MTNIQGIFLKLQYKYLHCGTYRVIKIFSAYHAKESTGNYFEIMNKIFIDD